jgi:SAM-dependent methyltransferase
MTVCDYSGIAEHYEDWCMGDNSYLPVASFYLSYLSVYTGVFAELGVGTGRIAIPLSNRSNVSVYGIDSCEAMLDKCRAQMSPETALTLINSDFLCFELPCKADIIYMPFRTIGHILKKNDLQILFECVYHNLKPKGLFIFDHYIFSKKWAVLNNNIDIPMYENGLKTITDRYSFDFSRKIMHCEISCNGVVVTRFDFHWFDVDEINAIYPMSGFSCINLMGDFDKRLWTAESPNQIWVLRRGE